MVNLSSYNIEEFSGLPTWNISAAFISNQVLTWPDEADIARKPSTAWRPEAAPEDGA